MTPTEVRAAKRITEHIANLEPVMNLSSLRVFCLYVYPQALSE